MKGKIFKLLAGTLAAFVLVSTPSVFPASESKAEGYYYDDDYLEVDNFRASQKTKSTITLKWRKTFNADGYQIYIYKNDTRKWKRLKTTSKTSYKVTKLKSGTLYRFKIRAYEKTKKGKVYGEWEKESFATKAKKSTKNITESKARTIAFNHAKVSGSDVWGYECEKDYEYGMTIYEIEFKSGYYEYSYEIDAATGNILSWEKEYDD